MQPRTRFTKKTEQITNCLVEQNNEVINHNRVKTNLDDLQKIVKTAMNYILPVTPQVITVRKSDNGPVLPSYYKCRKKSMQHNPIDDHTKP